MLTFCFRISVCQIFVYHCLFPMINGDRQVACLFCGGFLNPPGIQCITEALPYLSGSSTYIHGFSLWVNTAAIHYLTQGGKKNKGTVPNAELQLITLMSSLINNPDEFPQNFYFIFPSYLKLCLAFLSYRFKFIFVIDQLLFVSLVCFLIFFLTYHEILAREEKQAHIKTGKSTFNSIMQIAYI